MSAVADVVVIGAGHAGCEAAAAAARLGSRVILVTLSREGIGRLSCNPAIGGLAKGNLVRELDALGGLMGRVTDATTIQFRHLNTRKGLAVRASRAQVDIDRYPRQMQAALGAISGLQIWEGEVSGLRTAAGVICGVSLADGRSIDAPRVVLTTGTFLKGLLHHGLKKTPGGRIGDKASSTLSGSLAELGVRLGRLKTGTVPRLDAQTICWDALAPQADVAVGRFSFQANPPPPLPQIQCFLAYTSDTVHDIVRNNLDRAPLFTGDIKGVGPRYCPSIEDKVHRFPERSRHLLFLEPEGLDTDRVYVNGLSTSLPPDVQEQLVHAIPGLEQAKILQPGYAVEYDFADPRDLGFDLQHKHIPGLYLAGQVNGTSGYEEAAVQGFVAGVSAATGAPLRLGRHEAYIGVLIDDLTQRGVGGEPYRMFTSRAEHRLLLREDNADRRLMPRGEALGLVDAPTLAAFVARRDERESVDSVLTQVIRPTPSVISALTSAGLGGMKKPSTVEELLRRPQATWTALQPLLSLPVLTPEVAQEVEVEVKYAGYIARAQRRAAEASSAEQVAIPVNIEWESLTALSWEVRERLAAARPTTLGQLERLPAITPAAVQVVLQHLRRG